MTPALHVLTRVDDLALSLMETEAGRGAAVHCLCLHDAVYWAVPRLTGAESPPPWLDRLSVGAEDCARRSLAVPAEAALGYPAIVDALAGAARVVCW